MVSIWGSQEDCHIRNMFKVGYIVSTPGETWDESRIDRWDFQVWGCATSERDLSEIGKQVQKPGTQRSPFLGLPVLCCSGISRLSVQCGLSRSVKLGLFWYLKRSFLTVKVYRSNPIIPVTNKMYILLVMFAKTLVLPVGCMVFTWIPHRSMNFSLLSGAYTVLYTPLIIDETLID